MEQTVEILGIPFYNVSQNAFIEELMGAAANNERRFVVTANPEIVMHAQQDIAFNQAVLNADYIVADGIGVVKAASSIGKPLQGRVTGYDTMLGLLKRANEMKMRVYFLGAKPTVIEKVVEQVQFNYQNIEVVGARDGYFSAEESALIAEEITASEADFVFLALGFPRQEKWIAANLENFKKGIFIGVGGSFDVFSGCTKRAPGIWVKLNLEWLYRILSQPSRWRRAMAIPRFMAAVQRQRKQG
ncbi:WecB/TagA/CpsF family glycosyltransferase [Listeria booriae]|uniref:N-acetylglucosaminyldiphosphoundecaprenol N-acetyl-beta-D-mannosaminyltransferase n=1 Tax=Listeria booriae TaxID=1552123 RepID=A0A842D262_9LIST|nr:WecB/TagA/CpsF family glycosyltransferase [Listeria booriae]MBC2005403.1 WecB/TagA/CpsF family glycosyltransferase [Listeria booriae]